MHPDVSALIEHYKLEPLPVEGTLFVSTYRSRQDTPNGGPLGTAMIGLYCDDPISFSCFHRLPSDEIWHFYGGDPLRLVLLHPDGSSEQVVMGSNPQAGQHVQFIVPAATWQAGQMIRGGRYSLFGCTMAPGFTSEGFEAGLAADLIERYPERADDIRLLCITGFETRMPDGFAV
jgi:predicted cupin superfamily sugar epimerase